MGFGWLKPVAKIGATIAAPFTGGASLAAIPAIDMLGAGGAAMGAASQSQASNRGTKLEGQMDLMKLLMDRDQQEQQQGIAREQEGRASGSDAIRKLLMAQRVSSPGQRPNVSPYATPQRQPTGLERQGADAMSQEVMARLTGGNPIAAMPHRQVMANEGDFRVDPKLMDAGKMESILGWLSPLLSGLGKSRGGYGGGSPIIKNAGNPMAAGGF